MSDPNEARLVADAEAGNGDAQWILSQRCRQAGDLQGMLRWLSAASRGGQPDAVDALGFCHEKGWGIARDIAAALAHYDRAIAAGHPMAAFHKAELLYKSRDAKRHAAEIGELLAAAARAGAVPALRTIGYLAVQRPSSQPAGLSCLRRAAGRQDPVSALLLGWQLARDGRGDRGAEAAHFLGEAAAAGMPFAGTLGRALGAAAVRPAPQDDDVALPEPGALLFPAARDADAQTICEDPPISLYADVLDLFDCAYLIHLSRPHLRRADVIDPDGSARGQVSDVRTNSSTYLPFEYVDFIGRYIECKIVRETGESLRASEPMSILRYAPGEYYRPHVDYFNPRLPVSERLLEDGGQRTASAITYLTTPAAGGDTLFPRLDLSVRSRAGSTLWFRNVDAGGRIDERTLHAGDTVDHGEKWVVTKWFREQPTRYLAV